MLSRSFQEKLAKRSFLIVGRAGMDFYAEPPGAGIEDAATYSAHIGGSAGNAAVALSKLKCKTELVTCFSDDAIGRFVKKKLIGFGVETGHCRFVAGEARTSLAVVETRPVNTQSIIYRNGAADFELSTDDLRGIDFSDRGGLILSGTALAAEPSRSAVFHSIERAREAGIPIIIDMDYRPYSWVSADEAARIYRQAIKACDIIIGNDDEFAVAAGGALAGRRLAESLVQGVPEVVVYKKGERGSATFTFSRHYEHGVFPVQALKPTGAGDAFIGGFIGALANGYPVDKAVERGAASAAIVVTRVACSSAMPDADEIDAFMASHEMNQDMTGDHNAHAAN